MNIPNTSKFKLAAAAAVITALLQSTYAQLVVSTFDSGSDGWTFTTGVTHQSSGGNPAGYLLFIDSGPADGGQLFAPSSYLGDWSALDGIGVFAFDFRNFTGPSDFTAVGSVVVSGPGGLMRSPGAPNTTGTSNWQTIATPINESAWTIVSGTWADIIANVTQVRINMPVSSSATEITGVDNVRLVPEPSSTLLIILGVGTFILVRRKHASHRSA